MVHEKQLDPARKFANESVLVAHLSSEMLSHTSVALSAKTKYSLQRVENFTVQELNFLRLAESLKFAHRQLICPPGPQRE